MKKIYVSSSWSNRFQPEIVEILRKRGFEVYDFRHPEGRCDSNVWDELNVNKEQMYTSEFKVRLQEEKAKERFSEHLAAMQSADACILLLPCGNSSHIEAGYMKGLGKKVYILSDFKEKIKPELMYLVTDGFFNFIGDLIAELNRI